MSDTCWVDLIISLPYDLITVFEEPAPETMHVDYDVNPATLWVRNSKFLTDFKVLGSFTRALRVILVSLVPPDGGRRSLIRDYKIYLVANIKKKYFP